MKRETRLRAKKINLRSAILEWLEKECGVKLEKHKVKVRHKMSRKRMARRVMTREESLPEESSSNSDSS